MNQRISRAQLYDNRLYSYGETANRYKDVYIEIEINGEVLGEIRIEQLITDNSLGLTEREMRIIVNASKKLVQDPVYNYYIIDVLTRKIIDRQSFDY